MRQLLWIIILYMAVCSGCQFGNPKSRPSTGRGSDPFPDVPAIADADPTIRHAIAVRVPTNLQVVRRENSLLYGFTALQTTNLMVGYKMVTGIECEGSMHCDGVEQPLFMQRMSALAFDTSTNNFALNREKGIPQRGADCVFEYRVTIFETDIPAQHEWSPQSGKHYKVLCTHTWKETIK